MYCMKCGSENSDTGKFCTRCGAPLGEKAPNIDSQKPVVQQPVNEMPAAAAEQPGKQPAAPTVQPVKQSAASPVQSGGKENASGKKARKGILIAVGAICLAAVCVIAVVLCVRFIDMGTDRDRTDVSSSRDAEEADVSETQDTEEEEQPVYYLAKETLYYSDGSIDLWHEYAYDAAGNLIKETEYYSDGGIFLWNEYAYEIR